MKKHKNGKRNWKRNLRVFFYAVLRKSRYLKGNHRTVFRLSLDALLVQLNLNQDFPFLFIAIFVGLTTGYLAVMFHDAILLFSSFLFGGADLLTSPYRYIILALIPALGGLFVGLYNAYVVKTRPGHGLASVIKLLPRTTGPSKKATGSIKQSLRS